MIRSPRKPALLAWLATAAAGLSIMAAAGVFRSTDLSGLSLPEFEKRLVGCREGAVWCAYGDKLRQSAHFVTAAKAYQRALDFQPDLTAARINAAVALAQTNDADAFFDYFSRLSMTYPKVAVDLLERPELAAMRTDARWEPLAANARAQSVD